VRACLICIIALTSCEAQQRRHLKIVMYPFIPEYKTVLYDLKTGFEQKHKEIELLFVDLSSNYYSAGSPNDYIGNAKADIYELDSVFLQDFVRAGKVQTWPPAALAPENELLKNAIRGARIGSVQYGVPHWVCGNFLFFRASDTALSRVKTLSQLDQALGGSNHPRGKALMTDLKGKSTLGEFYLETAFDHYATWSAVSQHLDVIDPSLQQDLVHLTHLCDAGYCRNQSYHDSKPGIYGRQFARGNGRALVGYSETLHQVLSEANDACSPEDKCLADKDIDVVEFPTDDSGLHQISWVDSYVLDKDCNSDCKSDATAFIDYISSDDVYKQILLRTGSAPTYLLPAKASLYADNEVDAAAHLYPKLRSIIETADAPSDIGLNEKLRAIGKTLDSQLPQP